MTDTVRSIDEARSRGARGRVPPHDIVAEESLLGAMLLAPAAIDDAAELVAAEDFYKPAHGHLFAALVDLHGQGHATDPVTVGAHLHAAGLLDTIGGPATINALQAGTPATSHASSYARLVARAAVLRRLIAVAGEIAELGYSGPEDVDAALERAEGLVFEVGDRQVPDDTAVLSELFYGALEVLERRVADGGPSGVRVGLTDYDEITGGFVAGSLNVVAARPGMGKTHWCAHVAAAVARTGRPVYFVSAEMSRPEIAERFLALSSNVSLSTLRSGRMAEGHWPLLSAGTAQFGPLPIYVRSSGSVTVASLRAALRRMASRLGVVPFVVVDYLQLLTGARKQENRQVEVAEYARHLKLLAVDLGTEVLAAAQVNRNVEGRGDKRPNLADLRESGEIEAATDTVTFIYRDSEYNADAPKDVAELIVAKNRHGPRGTAVLHYVAETGRYNLARMF